MHAGYNIVCAGSPKTAFLMSGLIPLVAEQLASSRPEYQMEMNDLIRAVGDSFGVCSMAFRSDTLIYTPLLAISSTFCIMNEQGTKKDGERGQDLELQQSDDDQEHGCTSAQVSATKASTLTRQNISATYIINTYLTFGPGLSASSSCSFSSWVTRPVYPFRPYVP